MNINSTIVSIQENENFLKFIDIFKERLNIVIDKKYSDLKSDVYNFFELGYWFKFKLNKLIDKTLNELSINDYVEYVKLKTDKKFFGDFFRIYIFTFAPYSTIEHEWNLLQEEHKGTQNFIFYYFIVYILRKHKYEIR